MSYRAKFLWRQNTKFPIYERVLKDSGLTVGKVTDNVVDCAIYLDILEDFTYELQSNFQGYAEAIGSASSIAGNILGFFEKLNTLSAVGGKASNSSEFMKLQVWKETEPFRMSFKFVLETKTDPYLDVYAPAMALMSMDIISPVPSGEKGKEIVNFYTPGVNSASMKDLDPKTGLPSASPNGSQTGKQTVDPSKKDGPPPEVKKAWESSSKLLDSFSIVASKIEDDVNQIDKPLPTGSIPPVLSGQESNEIPLLIINDAYIKGCKPTWSKDRTASGIPIRCELEVQVESIFSANDAMFGWLKKTSLSAGQEIIGALPTVATNIFR
jgi:hypothetical protein